MDNFDHKITSIFCYSFFMKIGSILENKNFEKRIAITPEIAKKYISLD